MEGVTTAIVAFLFVCLVYPRLVKIRPQYYGAMAAVVLIILLDSLSIMFDSGYVIREGGALQHGGFWKFAHAMIGLLQVAAIILLILSVGGLTMAELAGDLGGAIEVMRRGDTEKTVIVPLTGEKPKPRQPREEPQRERADLTPNVPPRPASRDDDNTSLPLE